MVCFSVVEGSKKKATENLGKPTELKRSTEPIYLYPYVKRTVNEVFGFTHKYGNSKLSEI